jgi:glycosyltransferase involved in cell wall biosynthesis
MRVAIDTTFLSRPPSGTGVYLSSLLAAMERIAPEVEVIRVADADESRHGLASAVRHPLTLDRRLSRADWELRGFARAAEKTHPDLLHIPSFAAPFSASLHFVVTIHDAIPLLFPEYRSSRAMRALLAAASRNIRHASLVLAPSYAAAGDIANLLPVPIDRIRVTYEAADSRYRPLSDPTLGAEVLSRLGIRDRYVFNIGGLDVRKNIPLLLAAFAIVKSRVEPPVRLVIGGAPHSGNSTVYPPIEPEIRRLGLERDVILTGFVSEDEKLALYQHAALYVTPSLYEGFGLTALEAMSCGVPTIATRRSSFPEVVGHGGLLVEPEVEALASLMQLVLANPEMAADLRARGIERAATFSWERTASETIRAYREAIGLNPETI